MSERHITEKQYARRRNGVVLLNSAWNTYYNVLAAEAHEIATSKDNLDARLKVIDDKMTKIMESFKSEFNHAMLDYYPENSGGNYNSQAGIITKGLAPVDLEKLYFNLNDEYNIENVSIKFEIPEEDKLPKTERIKRQLQEKS
jgi:hypothetical protein